METEAPMFPLNDTLLDAELNCAFAVMPLLNSALALPSEEHMPLMLELALALQPRCAVVETATPCVASPLALRVTSRAHAGAAPSHTSREMNEKEARAVCDTDDVSQPTKQLLRPVASRLASACSLDAEAIFEIMNLPRAIC